MNDNDWSPPPNPEPQAILQEARHDTDEGRYAVALAKHLWFHREALRITPALYGVRLSFALSDWKDLASRYAPALEALKRVRDEAADGVLRKGTLKAKVEAFEDLVALNKYLGEESRTVDMFFRVETADLALAQQVFGSARNALIGAKALAICCRNLKLDAAWAQMWEDHRECLEHAQDNPRPEVREYADKSLTHEATTLIALAVVAGRKDEALKLAAEARGRWDDPAFSAAIETALQGDVPAPWP